MPKQRRFPGKQGVFAVVASLLAVAVLVPACSEPTRHRVLSFFFDGVPKPGEVRTRGYAAPVATRDAPPGAPQRVELQIVAVHPPYRENRCTECHNMDSGLLHRTPQEGLCSKCHPDVPGSLRFLHGPVAVGDCLPCHNPHASAYPKLLLSEGAKLCFRCHKREDLTTGPYHATIDTQACTECHDAHGGNTRFFLREEASVE